jgi:hypothetical protein
MAMKTPNILLILLATALVVGMILTALFGRGSRHGYGSNEAEKNPLESRVCVVSSVTYT